LAKVPGTPLTIDVGPGGFFLARVPPELWSALDLSYGELHVLDRDGTTLARSCRFLEVAPNSSLDRGEIGFAGDPLAANPADAFDYPCPKTGSAADAVRMRPAPPRAESLAGVTGRDIASGEPIALSSFTGRPLFLGVWDPHSPTSARLLTELDAFARRHPEAQILGILPRGPDPPAEHAVEDLALSFPTIRVDDHATLFLRDAHGGFGPHVVVLDARGRVAAELATHSGFPFSFYGLVTQETLEQALVSTD
jgi:hypothetical protein